MDRKAMEDRAAELGLKYPANIGDAKLAARIAAAEQEGEPELYIAETDIRHNGELVPASGFIELGAKDAAPLLTCGAITPADR